MLILTLFAVAAKISLIQATLTLTPFLRAFSMHESSYPLCHTFGIHYYEQVGCIPKHTKCGGCPIFYKCPDGHSKPDTCKIAGRIYESDENIVGTSPCLFCQCSIDENKFGNVACAMPECFVPPHNDTNCRVVDDLDTCCPQDIICKTNSSATCLVDNNIYEEAQLFEPKNTCLVCICNKGFKGIYKKPFCKPKPCDLYFYFGEQFQNNPNFFYECSPIYSSWDKCCPVDFLCDVPVNATVNPAIKTKTGIRLKCKLGKQYFSKGVTFSYLQTTDNVSVTCECKIPPLMHCRRND